MHAFLRVIRHCVAWGLLTATACSATPSSEATANVSQPDSIPAFDDPSVMSDQFSARLADNLSAADVGADLGVPEDRIPYPDGAWLFKNGGIDHRWYDETEPSPLEKFMEVTAPGSILDAKIWNRRNHGPLACTPESKGWCGLCQGWAGAAIDVAPVTHDVHARLDAAEGIVPCDRCDHRCTHFRVGDINALLAELYSDAPSRFAGARCDTPPTAIRHDCYGRVSREENGPGCKGLNAGSLLMILAHRLKREKRAIVMNLHWEQTTNEIWNKPVYRYRIELLEEWSAEKAVHRIDPAYEGNDYVFNPAARGFLHVLVKLYYVVGVGPNAEYVSGRDATLSQYVDLLIELDGSPADPRTTIIGGEYLVSPDIERPASPRRVPTFAWYPTAPGEARGMPYPHNPWVHGNLVLQLARLGRRPIR